MEATKVPADLNGKKKLRYIRAEKLGYVRAEMCKEQRIVLILQDYLRPC